MSTSEVTRKRYFCLDCNTFITDVGNHSADHSINEDTDYEAIYREKLKKIHAISIDNDIPVWVRIKKIREESYFE